MSQVEFDQNYSPRIYDDRLSTSPLVGMLMKMGVKSEGAANKVLVGVAVFAVLVSGFVFMKREKEVRIIGPALPEEYISDEFFE